MNHVGTSIQPRHAPRKGLCAFGKPQNTRHWKDDGVSDRDQGSIFDDAIVNPNTPAAGRFYSGCRSENIWHSECVEFFAHHFPQPQETAGRSGTAPTRGPRQFYEHTFIENRPGWEPSVDLRRAA